MNGWIGVRVGSRALLQAGFTLVELLVSALVVAVVMSAVIESALLAQATTECTPRRRHGSANPRAVHALPRLGPPARASTRPLFAHQSVAPILPRDWDRRTGDGRDRPSPSATCPPPRRQSLMIWWAGPARSELQPTDRARQRSSVRILRGMQVACSTGAAHATC
jgi:prepilin-type N-terminal cleavage/methylation domain-containing protein